MDPHVHLQTLFAHASFPTGRALEFGMRLLHMLLQGSPGLECFYARPMRTLVLIDCIWVVVFCNVVFQAVGPLELLATKLTVQFLEVYREDVRAQLRVFVEALSASFVRAHEGSGMCNLVSPKLLPRCNTFPAVRAVEGFFRCMREHMTLQMRLPRELPAAFSACERLQPLVNRLLVFR